MKRVHGLILATTVAIAPIAAHAGGLAPAIEEAPVVIVDTPAGTPSSVSNFAVPLLLLGLVGLAAVSSSGGGSSGGAKAIVTGE